MGRMVGKQKTFGAALSTAWPGLRYLGLGVWATWLFLISSGSIWLSDTEIGGSNLANLMLVMTVCSAAICFAAPLFQRFYEGLLARNGALMAIAALASVGALGVIAAGPFYLSTVWPFWSGIVAIGIFSGIFSLKCGQLFGALNARYILLYSLFGEIVVVLLSYFVLGNDIYHPIAGGPSLSGIIAFALLPLIATYLVCLPATDKSVLSGRRTGDSGESGTEDPDGVDGLDASTMDESERSYVLSGSTRFAIHDLPSSFWKFLLMIFFFTAASEMLRCYFVFMRVPTLTYIDSILVLLFRVAFALVILAFALRSSRQVSFGRMYQVSLVVVAVVMVLIPFFQTYNMILGSVIGLMTTVMSLLVWCLLSLAVFGKKISAIVVFGFGRGALLAGQVCGWILGIWVLPMLAESDWELAVYVGMAILILVMMTLFFSEKRLDQLFQEIVMVRVDLDLLPFDEKTLQAHRPWHAACIRAGEQAFLSPREQEIFELLASGRSPDNIAAHMKLSLHTVRTHIRNIYGKFDVHSKSELVSRVEEILDEEEGS